MGGAMDWFWLSSFQTQPTMFKIKSLTTLLLLVIISVSHAQEASTDTIQKRELPGSFIGVGYSPLNTSQNGNLAAGFAIFWEKPLSHRLSVGANVFRDLAQGGLDFDEFYFNTDRVSNREYRDIRTSLSLNVNYYFKPYAYDGFYATFRANNILSQSIVSDEWSPLVGMQGNEENKIMSRPRYGIYLGYRKVFKQGFFIDGSFGVANDNALNDHTPNRLDGVDFKLTIGWQIGWRKDKKRRRK